MEIRIAMVSMDPTVGALEANAEEIFKRYKAAVEEGVDLVVFPEMSLTGYPLQDLTQRPSFLIDVEREKEKLINRIHASGCAAGIIFGHPTDTQKHDANRRLVYNSATIFEPESGVSQTIHKVELPNYGVFDEKRNYLEGPTTHTVKFRGVRIGLMICEDGWYPNVTKALKKDGADILVWINGSPYSTGKNIKRRMHAEKRAKSVNVPVVYVNLTGGQDELVFDGDCFAWDGKKLIESNLFKEETTFVTYNIRRGEAGLRPAFGKMPKVKPTGVGENYRAKVLGFKDYLRKSGFKSVVIGMSGGIDSAAAASICVDAIGARNVHLVRLPSSFSSSGSMDDAAEAQKLLGCPMRTIPIEEGVNAARKGYMNAQWDTEIPDDVPAALAGVADENIQARQRAQHLMSISNMENRMLVTTGNKSEVSTGFATIGGRYDGRLQRSQRPAED